MTMAGRDLFHALRIMPEPPIGQVSAQTARRLDVGWGAWRTNTGLTSASKIAKLRFWLALWRHFGQAQYLVQVDNSYHTATTLRLRQSDDRQHIDVLLVQTASLAQCLKGLLRRRFKRDAPTWRKNLQGRVVVISRYPAAHAQPHLPALPQPGFAPCQEVLLDSLAAAKLPLKIILS